MLTGKQVRVRVARDRVIPLYIDAKDTIWLKLAEELRHLFHACQGKTRGELAEEIKELIGGDPRQLVHHGLAKLLEDRCEFEVVSGQAPDRVRESVFTTAANAIKSAALDQPTTLLLDRPHAITQAAEALALPAEAVEQALFADLKSEQRLIHFKDMSAERLLARYNVTLAQAVLLRATAVRITVEGVTATQLRHLLRRIKFHRLMAEITKGAKDQVVIHLDGPLSLFSATQKYGLQLALFLPALLTCPTFSLRAELLWGPQRKPKHFALTSADGLTPDGSGNAARLPEDLSLFARLFREKIADWELEDGAVVLLGKGAGCNFWVPDFRMVHRQTGRFVHLEVLGYWRRAAAEQHLERLREHVQEPFVLAVSDQLRLDGKDVAGLPAGIHRFRRMPLPEEIVQLAEQQLQSPAHCP